MLGTSGEHLSPEQIASLVEATEPGGGAAADSSPLAEARDHIAGCPQCAARVMAQQRVAAALRSVEVKVSSERSASCPRDDKWIELAAGLLGPDQAPSLTRHAASCDHCGPLLRAAMEDLNTEFTPQELDRIANLKSAGPEWQRELAARMSTKSHGGKTAGHPVEKRKPWWWSLNLQRASGGMRWAAAAAGLLLVAGASWFWVTRRPSLDQANQLVAQAYGENRVLTLRWQGAPYARNGEQRGGNGAQQSGAQNVLPEAEDLVTLGLGKYPGDPHWLQQSARIDLLRREPLAALGKLQPLVTASPNDNSLLVDEASAYFEASRFDDAIKVLNEVLAADPQNQVALFNRATIYHALGKTSDEIADWHRYLQLDSSSPWAEEARRRLSSVEGGSTSK